MEGLFVTLRIYDRKGELVPYVHNYRIKDFQMGFLVFEEVEKPILGVSWEELSVTYIREKNVVNKWKNQLQPFYMCAKDGINLRENRGASLLI